jgi:hypothetical protein
MAKKIRPIAAPTEQAKTTNDPRIRLVISLPIRRPPHHHGENTARIVPDVRTDTL